MQLSSKPLADPGHSTDTQRQSEAPVVCRVKAVREGTTCLVLYKGVIDCIKINSEEICGPVLELVVM